MHHFGLFTNAASRFLPYTVQFEVPNENNFDLNERIGTGKVDNSMSTFGSATPVPIGSHGQSGSLATPIGKLDSSNVPSSSILPSLYKANSKQQTPVSGSPRGYESNGNNSVEGFFYNHHKFRRTSTEQGALTDNLNEKLGPQYIQPRSRYSNLSLSSLLVDPKRTDEDLGLPSLKMNRLSNTLSALSNSSSNLLALNNAANSGAVRKSALNRPFQGLMHSNSSTSSLVIAEENEVEPPPEPEHSHGPRAVIDDWQNNFNEMCSGRSERQLAPFGGFSNPDIKGTLFNHESIFETAPWDVVFTTKGNVSLTKAVKLSVQSGIIQNRKWVGTLAMPSDEVPKHVINDIAKRLSDDYNSNAIFPNDITFQGHYNSFCKQILWPTLHYQIPDDPKSKAFEDHSWGHYQLLNQMVADKIVEVYKKENGHLDPDDPENMIWIHDYHLLLVPLMVREKLPNAKIGLFLHVSFPSSEVFRCFAQRNELLKGMLGANSISFQSEEYVRHFLQTCNGLLLADTNEFGITYEGNFTTISTIPVGIDANSVTELLSMEGVLEWRQLIRERWGDQKLIVSRDKLDRLRGIKQKLLAYEMLLQRNPEYIDTAVLIQICIGESQDPNYESEVMQIVARINALAENISVSQPVVLLQKDIDFDQYLALQCEAEVFVVSSMREGLNLTCHEFIAATSEKKSPLMLSEFTGSSQLLECNGEGALLINPWDIRAFSRTFEKLLTMDPKEKLIRWKNCFDIVVTRDSNHWVANCLKAINDSWERNQRQSSNNLIPITIDQFEKFNKEHSNNEGKRLYFFNFETPTATFSVLDNKSRTSAAITSAASAAGKSAYSEPARLASLLSDLLENPQNQVYLISFLKRSVLDRLYRRYPNFGLIAENGGYIKLIGSSKWISIVEEDELKSWMPQVTQLIQSKVERLPGSFCEVEDCTIKFLAGNSFVDDRERSLGAMGECIQHINELFQDQESGVHATLIKNFVIVQQNQLALKAMKFIFSYYKQKQDEIEQSTLISEFQVKPVPKSHPTTPITEKSRYDISSPIFKNSDKLHGVSSIFVGGGSTPIDEPNYEFANALFNEGDIEDVLTVAILGSDPEIRTSANYGVNGKNELLSIISKSNLTNYR